MIVFATAAGLMAATPATAQFSASAGFESTTGRYGKPTRTDETVLPVALSYRAGPWRLRAGVQLLKRVEGSAIAAAQDGEIEEPEFGEEPEPGAGPTTTRRSQSGPGDLNLSAFYTLWGASGARPGLELGARLKQPLADRSQCLLTNGVTDLSLEARVRQSFGPLEPFVALGWTRRGDPLRRDDNCVATGGRTNLRNPLYTRIGASLALSPAVLLEAEYEYRQKIRASGKAKSELKLGAGVRLGRQLELVGYGIVGFSDASPDRGVGASLTYRF